MLESVTSTLSTSGAVDGVAPHTERRTALAGVRVLDVTQFEAGTSCTETLAWLGADVIKVEEPGRGEQGRRSSTDRVGVDSPYFLLLNANKSSVTCNLKDERGKALLRGLIEKSDVFVENFGPGVIERLGFGYEDVRAINPRIIFAQIKGFAPDGPYAKVLAFDPIAQAAGGGVSITGEADGRPLKPGLNVGDTGAGLHCAIGILGALFQREHSGVGQRIEITMQESIINFGRIAWATQALTGKAAPRVGNQSIIAGTSPSEVYPCLGGGPNDYVYIYTSRAGSHHWDSLLRIIGREDLKEDPRFSTPGERAKRYKEVDAIVAEWTRLHDKRDVMLILGDAGVPAGAVFDTKELSEDPHLRKRGMFVTVQHPVRGEFTMPASPIRMSESFVPVEAAPLLGAQTDSIYRDLLGLAPDEIETLRAQGIV